MIDQVHFAAIKARLTDVPGIEGLSVSNVGGRLEFGMAGKIAATAENAPDADIESAIRIIFGSKAPAPTAAPLAAPPSPAVTAIPATVAAAKEQVMSVTGAAHVGTSLKDMLTQRKQAMAAAHDKLAASFAKLDQATDALNTVGDKVGAEADDLMSTLGQFTNDLG